MKLEADKEHAQDQRKQPAVSHQVDPNEMAPKQQQKQGNKTQTTINHNPRQILQMSHAPNRHGKKHRNEYAMLLMHMQMQNYIQTYCDMYMDANN